MGAGLQPGVGREGNLTWSSGATSSAPGGDSATSTSDVGSSLLDNCSFSTREEND